MARRLYSLLLYLALPFVLAHFLWRGRRARAYRGSVRERLAFGLTPGVQRPLWLHAASVGEVRALAALVHALPADAAPLLITVGTPTGLARARELFGAAHAVHAAPWDLPGATRRFVAAMQPRALVIVETELWPNLIAACAAQGLPMALASARLSARSLARYRRFAPGLMCEVVRAFTAIGAQDATARQRFVALGAAVDRTSVTGNLKFDVPLMPDVQAQAAALRARWAPARALWVAGSTHPGEEAVLLDAHRQLLDAAQARGGARPLLAFAPRRPERFPAVARWLAQSGLRHASVSAQGAAPAQADAVMPGAPDVLLIDQMGVLQAWYGAADVAYVGGTLVPVGGHNLLEPAALARPVLCGPGTSNAPDVASCLVEAGGAQVVRDAGEIAAALMRWLADPASAAAAGACAAAAVQANRGAARRAMLLVTGLARPGEPSATG